MMRNIDQYPVTIDEKIDAVEWAIAERAKTHGDVVGDIIPTALSHVLHDLKFLRIARGIMSTGD